MFPFTVTVAVPDFSPSPTEVAVTVKVAAVSAGETESVPALLITVPATPPVTVHFTASSNTPVPATVASNVKEAPLLSAAVVGDTVTPVMVFDGVDPSTKATAFASKL